MLQEGVEVNVAGVQPREPVDELGDRRCWGARQRRRVQRVATEDAERELGMVAVVDDEVSHRHGIGAEARPTDMDMPPADPFVRCKADACSDREEVLHASGNALITTDGQMLARYF